MDSKTFREVALSYLAVYDQDLREEMDNSVEEERAPGVKAYRPNPTQAEVRANIAKASKEKASAGAGKSGYGPEDKFKSDWKLRATPSSTSKRKDGSVETVSQRMDREKPYGKRMTGQMAREYGSRHAAEVSRVVKGSGEPQSVTYPRQKSKVSKEEVENWVNSLLEEGYDLSDYTWEEMFEIYEGRGRWGSDMKRNRSAISSALSGNVWSTHPASRTSSDIKPKQSSRPQSNYRANLSKTDRAELAVTARKERKDGEDFDSEYTPSRKKVEKAIKKLPLITKNPKKLRKQASIGEEIVRKEEMDIFDVIFSHLLDEGYASTPEAATAIMANMSEEWIESILG